MTQTTVIFSLGELLKHDALCLHYSLLISVANAYGNKKYFQPELY